MAIPRVLMAKLDTVQRFALQYEIRLIETEQSQSSFCNCETSTEGAMALKKREYREKRLVEEQKGVDTQLTALGHWYTLEQ